MRFFRDGLGTSLDLDLDLDLVLDLVWIWPQDLVLDLRISDLSIYLRIFGSNGRINRIFYIIL